jgi:hypothetical protein
MTIGVAPGVTTLLLLETTVMFIGPVRLAASIVPVKFPGCRTDAVKNAAEDGFTVFNFNCRKGSGMMKVTGSEVTVVAGWFTWLMGSVYGEFVAVTVKTIFSV